MHLRRNINIQRIMVRNVPSPCSVMGFTGLEITGKLTSIILPEKFVMCAKTMNIFAKNNNGQGGFSGSLQK